MKTKILIGIFGSILVLQANAQTWTGSTTASGNINRTGNVAIGPNSNGASIDAALVLYPTCGQTAGLKILGISPWNNTNCGANTIPDGLIVSSMPQFLTARTDFIVKGSSGQTGIGTATPNSQLEIKNNNSANAILRLTGNAGNTAMFVLDNGNVGIGGVFASEKLDVLGNIRINNGDIYLRSGSDVNHGIGFYDNTGQSKVFAATSINGPVVYGYGGGALGTTAGGQKVALKWNSAGQVMIGNLIPSNGYALFKLSVDGDIVDRRVVAQTTQWADKVFSNSYNLQSLSELEKYIILNNHLPEIPSECKAIENGVNLGEMNVLLLQKIEELTLHLIKQEKRIKFLEKQTEN